MEIIISTLGQVDYLSTYHAMQEFTRSRESGTLDQLWLCEHPAVFTPRPPPEHATMRPVPTIPGTKPTLRLRHDVGCTEPRANNQGPTENPPALIFPRKALDQAARHARPLRLVADIERALESMQGHLDDLKDQVQQYRFPPSSDLPPPAAA